MAQLDPAGIRARIREARKGAGLTQEQLAALIDRHKRTVENYERVRVPDYAELNKIARVLDKPIEWFLHGDQETETGEGTEQLADLLARLEAVVERLERGQGRAQDG